MRLILDCLIVIFMFAGSSFCFRKIRKSSLSLGFKYMISTTSGILFMLSTFLLDRDGFFGKKVEILLFPLTAMSFLNNFKIQEEHIPKSDREKLEEFAKIYPTPMLVKVLSLSSFKDILGFAEAEEKQGRQPFGFGQILISIYLVLVLLSLVLTAISQEQFGFLILLLVPFGLIILTPYFIFSRASLFFKYPFIVVLTENKLSIAKKIGDSGQVVGSWLFSELKNLRFVPSNNLPFFKKRGKLLQIETKQGGKYIFHLKFERNFLINQGHYEELQIIKRSFLRTIQEKSKIG